MSSEAERKLSAAAKAILALFREGRTNEYVASRLKMEEKSIQRARASMVQNGISLWAVPIEAPPPLPVPPIARMVVPALEDIPLPAKPGPRPPTPGTERDPRRASIWHLVDLKRAGHSPTRTELIVPSDGAIAVVNRYRTHGSVVGSSSAMCCD